MTLRPAVIWALFQRNFSAYFSGVLGYLFILVFVVIGGSVAFGPSFFSANESNLDQLTAWYPLLLLFFIPAITMGTWADERKSGTDELLFTLPASDLEILLGKYLSAVAVYSVALLFSTSHAAVLAYLGAPDPGLLLSTYFGYWAAGCALIGAGMLGSILTNSMAVAFVYGILLCSIPVFAERVGSFISLGPWFAPFGLDEQLRSFSIGMMSLSSFWYLSSLTIVSLYLNYIMMTKRHWGAYRGQAMPAQYSLRSLSVMVFLGCFTTWAGYTGFYFDTTSERLFSLAPITRTTLAELQAERPIEIQAFISPDVPQEYVDTRKRLIRLLEQFDRLGGNKLQVRIVDTEPFTPQAEEAEHLGIKPVHMLGDREGRPYETDVFLGAVVISSYDKIVVPFFGKALPIEYELTRAISSVSTEQKKTIGVLETDAGMMSGGSEWPLIAELKRHYKVESVSADEEYVEREIDMLIVGMPSSLTSEQTDRLLRYVQDGRPALIFDDPIPVTLGGSELRNAPRLPKPAPGGPPQPGMPEETKADGGRATRLLNALGIAWTYDEVVFDFHNPHPEFEFLPPEYVFVAAGEPTGGGFHPDLAMTQDLVELITLYPGSVRVVERNGFKVVDLMRTGQRSGIIGWDGLVEEISMEEMMAINPMQAMQMRDSVYRMKDSVSETDRTVDEFNHSLAVRITGENASSKINAIYVADIDMISSFFFQERVIGELPMRFDNVTFVLNAIDTLVGDESFIGLRSRRESVRTLTAVESKVQAFRIEANEAIEAADKEAEAELDLRKKELERRAQEILNNDSYDVLAKRQLLQQAQVTESQRLQLAEDRIEADKENQISKIRARMRTQIDAMESQTRFWSILGSSLPATLLGLAVFVSRLLGERANVIPHRQRAHGTTRS